MFYLCVAALAGSVLILFAAFGRSAGFCEIFCTRVCVSECERRLSLYAHILVQITIHTPAQRMFVLPLSRFRVFYFIYLFMFFSFVFCSFRRGVHVLYDSLNTHSSSCAAACAVLLFLHSHALDECLHFLLSFYVCVCVSVCMSASEMSDHIGETKRRDKL